MEFTMSNLAINKTAIPLKLSTITDKNTVSNSSNFSTVLKTSTDLPAKNEMPTFSGKIKMSDGSIADVQPVHQKIFTHDESVKLLQESGMTQAEAEEILKPIPPQPEQKEQSPQEMKAYLMSEKIEAMVRDKTGSIVAILYKNGSSMNLGYDGGTYPAEKLSKLEKDPNVTVTHYQNFSSFDMLKEQVALQEKMPKQPIIYNTQEERDFYNTQKEVFEFQKRILAA